MQMIILIVAEWSALPTSTSEDQSTNPVEV